MTDPMQTFARRLFGRTEAPSTEPDAEPDDRDDTQKFLDQLFHNTTD